MTSNMQAPDWNPWGSEEQDFDPWRTATASVNHAISIQTSPAIQHTGWNEGVSAAAGRHYPSQAHHSRIPAVPEPYADAWSQQEPNELTGAGSQVNIPTLPRNLRPTDAQDEPPDPWEQFDRMQSERKTGLLVNAPPQIMQQTVPAIVQSPAEDPWDQFEKMQIGKDTVPTTVKPKPAAEQHMWPFIPPPRALVKDEEQQQPVRQKSRSPRPPRDENVLFDAENLTDTDDEYTGFDTNQPYDTYDDFGDFETAAREVGRHNISRHVSLARNNLHAKETSAQPSLLDLDDMNDTLPTESRNVSGALPHSKLPLHANTKPLLDPFGSLDDDDDDFGQFSGVTEPITQNHTIEAKPHSVTDQSIGLKQTNKLHPQDAKPHVSRVRSSTQKPSDWENWDDDVTPTTNNQTANIDYFDQSSWRLLNLLEPASPATTGPPPANLPPPALLISLFPSIITIAKAELFDHLHESTSAQQTRTVILSNPATKSFISQYLTIATVLARIIAGRKLRWKRDTLLGQSMRIGHAVSGGGGMKLASIDKGETVREEREVANVVGLWRAQLGKLKSTVVAAGLSQSIPDIAEVLPVRTAPSGEGAIIAPKPCVLCALKRNERIPKVDLDVQDTFGEWWVGHWGHAACKAFWETNEKQIRSR